MRKTIISWGLLFACNLMWSLQFTCIKLTQDQVGPYFTVWAPMLLAAVFLTPFALRDFKNGGKKFKDVFIFGQLALLGVFPAQVLMTWGTQYSLASNAAILTLCLPVVSALFAFLILKEKMNKIRWISFVIAIIGVILCSTGDMKGLNFGSKYAIGNILIFIAIVGNAYYNTGIKKISQRYTEIEMVFLILKEKMNKIRWISFVIAIIGVILCSTGDMKGLNFGSKYAIGNILIFIAIVGNAYYNTGIKKISQRYTEIEMVFFTYVVMVILLTPLVIYYEKDIFTRIPVFTTQTWIGMGLLTFFHNFLSMLLFFKALKVLDAMQVALSNYMIAFFGLPVAAFWLGEKLNSYAIAGGILVLISTLIITIVDYRMSHITAVKVAENKIE